MRKMSSANHESTDGSTTLRADSSFVLEEQLKQAVLTCSQRNQDYEDEAERCSTKLGAYGYRCGS
jgi:hypothetical protein